MLSVTPEQTAILLEMKGRGAADSRSEPGLVSREEGRQCG
jgi:hypothetical protein